MRFLAMLVLVAACPRKGGDTQEPAPPPSLDAAVVDAAPDPVQTPQASTSIRASSYPQNCTRNDECIGVFEGDACNPCRCAFNAIRVDAFPKYKSDIGAFWSCHKPEDCKADCRQKVGAAARCEAGTRPDGSWSDGTCVLPP